ncbi:SAVED domain-containing protein [Alkalicoccus urumqiensis]|uniref:SMODS-associated and fused to various effectors domain-containing protein n=1 Tax=Alkalicoccus urumqiensis TaxID=1548213 RepID=A0A2P6MJL2_ALKUR|nr:SAVED domain-containing protein [Alkalicoccus urumqiensis]PRO66470.1 hypothetical protein C6I21_03780 [Alkalicoccus urumqiensis]
MANPIRARQLGDDYQKIFFWLKACEFLEENSNIDTISYEDMELKSLDDVVIRYKQPIKDFKGNLIKREYYQVKYHVTYGGSITLDNLMDPKFINASKFSFLKKVKEASFSLNTEDEPGIAILVTPWTIHPNDVLSTSRLIDTQDGSFRLETLFDEKNKSHVAKAREKLKEHLDVQNDKELESIIKLIRISSDSSTYSNLVNLLNSKLSSVGLRPINATQRINPYISLLARLFQEGKTKFNKEELIQICKDERLWTGTNIMFSKEVPIGIRSFMHRARNMENNTSSMICLSEHFEGRHLKENFGWNEDIKRKIDEFLTQNLTEGGSYCIHLDTHSSVAFTAGYYLDPKSGVKAVPIQKGLTGREVWRSDSTISKEQYPQWKVNQEVLNEDGEHIAIIIEMTHSALEEVENYISDKGLSVKTKVRFYFEDGPNASSIQGGVHARHLANEILRTLKNLPPEDRKKRYHIFGAAPNGFWFILGQLSRSFGQITLYEYDFEIAQEYRESINLP